MKGSLLRLHCAFKFQVAFYADINKPFMKNKVFLATVVIIAIAASTSQSQNTDQGVMASRTSSVSFVAPELRIETKDSIAAYELFRSEAHIRMAQYEKSIDEFSARLAQEKPKVQNKNYPKVVALEKKDAKLRIKIESYKPENGGEWITFKNATTAAIDTFGEEVARLKIKD